MTQPFSERKRHMADLTPNYSLEVQGMMLERAQFELNIMAQTYRIAQAHDEVRRISVNIEATKVAIAALDEKITSLTAG